MAEVQRGSNHDSSKYVERAKGPPPPPGLHGNDWEYALKNGPPNAGGEVLYRRDTTDISDRARVDRPEGLGDTAAKAREAIAKEHAARDAKFGKAMKAAEKYAVADDTALALRELRKAHDAAGETSEELQVAKKAAELGDRKLAWDALYAARNLAGSPGASDRVAKIAGDLGFDDIAAMAADDAKEAREKKAAEKAEEAVRKAPKKDPDAPRTPEERSKGVGDLLTDPSTWAWVSYGVAAYQLGKSTDSGTGKTGRKR